MKKNIVATVFKTETEYETLEDYVKTINSVYTSIHEEFRGTACIKIEPFSSYDGELGVVTYVEVTRPETDDEEHQRELVELRAKLQEENREKELFKRLKKKYENN